MALPPPPPGFQLDTPRAFQAPPMRQVVPPQPKQFTPQSPDQAALTRAQTDAARLNAQQTTRELAVPSQDAQMAGAKAANIRAMAKQLNRVRELHRKYLKGGFPQQVGGVLPFAGSVMKLNSKMGAFDSAAKGLAEIGLAAFRVPGVGSQSDTELRNFVAANTPQLTDSDDAIEEKLGNLERRMTEQAQVYGMRVRPEKARPQEQPAQRGGIKFLGFE